MALIKFGGGVVGMAGSIAGSTFSRNRSGSYARARTKPINPMSSGQVLIRSCVAQLAQRWNNTVTDVQRIAWQTYADAVAMKNRLGETIYLSGFNHYIRSNVIRKQTTAAVADAAPTTLSLPEQDTTFAVTASVAANKLSITWDGALPWVSIPNSLIAVYMGVPQMATRNFFNGPWQLSGCIAPASAHPILLDPPFTLVAGQKIWVYGRISEANGRLSEPFRDDTIIVA